MSEKLGKKVLSLRAVIRIVAALALAVYELLHFNGIVPKVVHEGFIVALLIFVIEQAIEIAIELSSAREADESAKLETLAKYPILIRNLAIDLHDQLSRALEIRHDGFTVNNRALAISSYSDFWQLLIDEQEKRGKETPIHIEAIHSGPLYLWTEDTPQGTLIYQRHKQFIDEGGKVTRILCGSGAKPDLDFARAGQKMKEVNISVKYYDIRSNKVPHSFTWDFLKIAGTNQVVIWDSFSLQAEQNIERAIYKCSLKHEEKDIQHLWKEIMKYSTNIE